MELVNGLNDNDIHVSCDCRQGHSCRYDAAYIVRIHQAGNCSGDCDSFKYMLLCRPCTSSVSESLGDYISRRISEAQVLGGENRCGTCGMSIKCLHDVMSVEVL